MNLPVDSTQRDARAANRDDWPTNVVDLTAYRRAAVGSAGTESQHRGHSLGLIEPDAGAVIEGSIALALGRLLHRSRRPGCVAALAIIRFTERRLLEETFGSTVGIRLDAWLQARLRAVLRPGDQCLPLEHDTVVVLLDDLAGERSAMTETRRLCREAGGTVRVDGLRFTLTGKAGVVLMPTDSAEPDTLLRYARIAMRHAAGSPTIDVQRYAPHMLTEMREQVAMAAELQEAIDDDRLELYY
ncbi:MAG: diguanylate cyclase, partial [Sedimenticolaceae bacterium]